MRNRYFSILVLSTALSLTGCAWAQRLKEDPIAALQEGVGYIRTALSLATAAFEVWATANPNSASEMRTQLQIVTGNVDRGLILAQDGLRLAAEAREPAPNTTELLRQAQTAMGALHDFLSGLPGREHPGVSPNDTMAAALHATERASRPIAMP